VGATAIIETMAAELAANRDALAIMAAQEQLVPFAGFAHCGRFRAPRHLQKLARALEAVERGDIKRLIVAMPPRHGKSHLVSETFPAWYLGRNPDKYVISATYAQEFADDIGRKVRNTMADPSYGALFPKSMLAKDSTSVRRFSTVSGGSYFSVGAGGPITGRGAHLLLIDDPLKSREDADSEIIRKHLRDWYASVAYTRLMPGGAVVIIATRWHEDDLTGWLLRDHQHEDWTVIDMPAISDVGEALWPEQYPLERLREIERTIGVREWSALYQQRPAPVEGVLFKPERITPVDALPAGLKFARGWDLAATAQLGTNDPDWTVGALVGRDTAGVIYIADIVRLRGSPLDVERAIANTAARDRAEHGAGVSISLPQDPGQAGKAQAQAFVRMLAGYVVETTPETGDKATRAAPLAAQVEAGNVRMLKAPWNRDLLGEMSVFPAGKHDDQVDALSRAFAKVCVSNTSVIDFYAGLSAAKKA